MKRNFALLFAMLVVSGIVTGSAYADVPMLLSHQGRLLDASDQPVTGTRDITFHIYGDSTGGSPLWTEEHLDVPIANGLFHVTLGGTVIITADLLANTGPGAFDPTKWMVLQIEGTELLPRMRLGSVPSAVLSSRVSGDVETLPGALTVKGMSGSTTGTIRMQATGDSAIFGSVLDVDGDDIPDVGSGSEALVPRNILKSFFQTGDFPTQAQFTTQSGSSSMDLECLEIDEEHTASVSADSTGAELKFKDGPILGGMSGSTTGTIRVGHGGGGGGGIGGDAFTVTGIFQDGTSEDVTEMKTARKDITINLRHTDLTGVEGDQTADVAVDSGGSELRLGSGPLSGMSGSTTGTIRVGATGGGGGGGGLGNAFTAIGTFSDGSTRDVTCDMSASLIGSQLNLIDDRYLLGLKSYSASVDTGASNVLLESDLDGDGIVENSIWQKVDNSENSIKTSSRFGSGPRQSTSMDGSFSHARMMCGTDLDDDGNNDVAVECKTTSVSGALTVSAGTLDVGGKYKLFSVTGQPTPVGEAISSRMAVGDNVDHHDDRMIVDSVSPSQALRLTASDVSGDGIPDIVVLDRATASAAITRLSGMSGSTTGTIRMMATADSVDREMTFDDPLTGASMKVKEKGSRTKCSSNLRFMTPTDSSDVLMECDSTSARHGLSGMSGSTTGTIRMAATPDSADHEVSFDDTLSGVSSKVKEQVYKTKSSTLLQFKRTTDSSGVEETCDSTGARSILSGMSGSTTGTIRMAASPDSGVIELGYSGSTTATIRLQASSSVSANPIEHSSGAHLTVGGDWTNASDKDLKENFTKIDGEELLEKIEDLTITQWNYKNQDESVTHIGPTAQDFQKTFGVGSNDKTISTIDPSGIALAAIKQLIKENQELRERIKVLEETIKK